MALEDFEEETSTERITPDKKRPRNNIRSIMNYCMGVLWIGLGVFFCFLINLVLHMRLKKIRQQEFLEASPFYMELLEFTEDISKTISENE